MKIYGYLKLNHNKIVEIMNENIDKNMTYIEIADCFNLNSYYKTDLHIKQEEYEKAVMKISKEMTGKKIDFSKYSKEKITDFYGIYYGQSMIDIGKDEIYCLKDENTENSIVYNFENNKETKVYDLDKLKSRDLYDVFLSGPVSILEIRNENVTEEKELIVFRDSFASSLAPLLLQNYSKITLIDIRYVLSDMLEEFVEFKNQDVLFLYNDLILNNSTMLK